MGYGFSQSDIHISNPVSAGQPFKFNYEVTNNGAADPGHYDHVQIWGSDGTVIMDEWMSTPPCDSGGLYGVMVDVQGLEPGYYDVAITLDDGTAAGSTIIVQ